MPVVSHGNFQPENETALAHRPVQNDSMINIIARAASDPTVDIDKMERLIALQVRLMEMESVRSFNADIAAMQEKIIPVIKRGKADYGNNSTKYSYAKYADIDAVIKPVLTEFGFSLSFSIEGNHYVGKLSHKLGHSISTSIELPIDKTGSKNAIQAQGSTITYAMRYLASMLLNIATLDDNDAHKPTEFVSEAEWKELDGLVTESAVDKKAFLEHLQVTDLKELPKSKYLAAKATLTGRINRNKNKAN